jgi:lipopolysaccharide/colanic/teichoic acid biosynthesis glycosyltransferase
VDELPQLINVLKGDMQLVGPRPEVQRYAERFRSEYEQLLQDRPGITDPATLAYREEEKIFFAANIEEQYISEILPGKLRISLAYQKRRDVRSDLEILVKTIFHLGAVLPPAKPNKCEDSPKVKVSE